VHRNARERSTVRPPPPIGFDLIDTTTGRAVASAANWTEMMDVVRGVAPGPYEIVDDRGRRLAGVAVGIHGAVKFWIEGRR
jgi:hypothetical protein